MKLQDYIGRILLEAAEGAQSGALRGAVSPAHARSLDLDAALDVVSAALDAGGRASEYAASELERMGFTRQEKRVRNVKVKT